MSTAPVEEYEATMACYARLRDGNSLAEFEELRYEAEVKKSPLAGILIVVCHCLGYVVNEDEAKAKATAPQYVPWLREICESPNRLQNPVFPIAAYPYSLCLYYELDCEENLDRYYTLLQEALSVKEYPFLINAVAHAFQYGHGTAIVPTEALRLYRKAADMGFPISAFNLSECYTDGFGTRKDEFAALDLCKQSIALGYRKGLLKIGNCYFYGRGVVKNHAEAVKWYLQAAEIGMSSAEYRLAYCYQQGVGVEQNWLQAVEWAKKAGARGHSGALYTHASILMDGDHGVTRDVAQATEIWHNIAQKKDYMYDRVSFALARHYIGMFGQPRQPAEALKWFWEVCQSEDMDLASLFQDPAMKVFFFLACELNHSNIMKRILAIQNINLTLMESQEQMRNCLPIAAELGLSLALTNQLMPLDLVVEYEMNPVCNEAANRAFMMAKYSDAKLADFRLRLENGLDFGLCSKPLSIAQSVDGYPDIDQALVEIGWATVPPLTPQKK